MTKDYIVVFFNSFDNVWEAIKVSDYPEENIKGHTCYYTKEDANRIVEELDKDNTRAMAVAIIR